MLRRLAGQMGLSPVNCRKVMHGIHSVSRHVQVGTVVERGPHPGRHRSRGQAPATGQPGGAGDDALLPDHQPGALSMESELRAATPQLESRQRRFGIQLLRLPQGDQAWEIVGAPTAIGRRLTNVLAYAGRTETTVLLPEPETLNAELLQEEEAEANAEAEKDRRGLTIFMDGSRLGDGNAGYAVVWKNGLYWMVIKTYMGYTQKADGAECAALARALE